MKEKVTNIVAHLLLPGLIVAFFSKSRKNCKFYLNQNIAMNLLAVIIFLLGYIPFAYIEYVQGGLAILLGITWLYSLLGAVWEVKHYIPGLSGIKFF